MNDTHHFEGRANPAIIEFAAEPIQADPGHVFCLVVPVGDMEILTYYTRMAVIDYWGMRIVNPFRRLSYRNLSRDFADYLPKDLFIFCPLLCTISLPRTPHPHTRSHPCSGCSPLPCLCFGRRHRECYKKWAANQRQKRVPLIRKADAIYELSVVTQFEDELGIYRDSKNLVVVNSGLDDELDVFELATNVLNFLGNELVALGILTSYEDFPIPEAPGVKVVPRIETTESNFASTIGVGMKMRFRFQVFDKEKCVPVIQDLSKEKLTFRAFPPKPVKLDVWIQNKKTGELKKCQATLPLELSEKYMALPND